MIPKKQVPPQGVFPIYATTALARSSGIFFAQTGFEKFA
jgi:hypothetical protein